MQEDNNEVELDEQTIKSQIMQKVVKSFQVGIAGLNKIRKGVVVDPTEYVEMLGDAVHELGNIAIGNKDSKLKKYVKHVKALLTKVEYHCSDYYRNVYTESVVDYTEIDALIEEVQAELEEALNAKQRMKMKQAFKKSAAKRKIGMKKSRKKLKDPEKLKKTANKKARDIIAKKIMKGKDKSDMSFSQRKSLEKRLAKKKGAISKLAKKLKPKVKKADKERVAKARSSSK